MGITSGGRIVLLIYRNYGIPECTWGGETLLRPARCCGRTLQSCAQYVQIMGDEIVKGLGDEK